ncbi:hypothetical protein EGX98_01025 [Fusobacterium necrophorum]|nr:hypothetical protein [Fusobacterium necrophorum]AYZ72776.1 hypothetical protein EGX98_01025 [Fusobacterium necrophorum]AZW09226.1 hypothetical protein EO219_06360 [Fusobacterium necrophorum subsp. necrophorum]SDB42067.1 hypothetical protein SAMN02983009_02018 [Fusobacterium necrophorum]SQD10250.1 Uncharacterised protein [Fusobacterium necrophorum subsp. necrophorum]
MKKKLFLILFLLGLSMASYSNGDMLDEAGRKEAQKLLENVRKRIEKEEKERAKILEEERKAAKLAEEEEKEKQKAIEAARKRTGEPIIGPEAMVTGEEVDVTKMGDSKDKLIAEYLKEKERLAQEEKKNLKTPMEKLEATQKLANEKVDFYERVVRSVAREEKEVKEYKEILNSEI